MTTSRDRLTPAALAALLISAEPHAVLDVRERGAYERGTSSARRRCPADCWSSACPPWCRRPSPR